MPGTADGYDASGAGLEITALVARDDSASVRMRMAGEVDIAAKGMLADTVAWLAALAPVTVLIDLAEVTYAGSTLPDFVARASRALPHGTEMVLWGAKPLTHWVLQVTDMGRIATITDGGPGSS